MAISLLRRVPIILVKDVSAVYKDFYFYFTDLQDIFYKFLYPEYPVNPVKKPY